MHTGQLTVGDLSAFILYSGYVALSISGLSNFFTALNQSLGASTRLWELTDRVPAVPLQGLSASAVSQCFRNIFAVLLRRFPDLMNCGSLLAGR